MELRQTQKLTQKLALTPLMRQSLYVLQLPLIELKEYVEKQIEENPVIEREVSNDTPIERMILEDTPQDTEYQYYHSDDSVYKFDKKKEYKTTLLTKPISLHEVLLQQLRMYKLKPKEYAIGELIIHYIDDNGYLSVSEEEIAKYLNDKLTDAKITIPEVEKVLSIIQRMEPIGVGARNLKECLTIQLKTKNKANALVYKIVENHLADVARKKVRVIAKKLRADVRRIKAAIKEISKLEPKPGRIYTSFREQTIEKNYPDIIVEKSKSGYEIIINDANIPRFRISSYYKNVLKSKNLSPQTRKYIQEKIQSALSLKKTLTQRGETLKKVTERLIHIQKEFFEGAEITSLKPLTFKEMARLLKRNESTISRVVNSKYIKTPQGIFRLSELFTKPANLSQQTNISREAIKTKIYNIIAEESKKHPLNDTKIVSILKKENINISRRTVAKYREELKIPPSTKRKHIKGLT